MPHNFLSFFGGAFGGGVKLTLKVVVAVAPLLSVTVIVMGLSPLTRAIVAAQDVVPVAVPLAPEAPLDQVIWVTVAGDVALAVPLTVTGDDVEVDGADVTVTVGG
jgi:hypothetical protein